MTGEMIKKLKKIAARKCWSDECNAEDGDVFCVDDFAGGNIDDAYFGGVADGRADLARSVLDCIGVAY